jgi:hypothetical protein
MNKRGVEELGPAVAPEWIVWAILSMIVLVVLIVIFARLGK